MDVRVMVAGTAVMTALAGTGGWFTGQALAGPDRPTVTAAPSPSATATPTAQPTATASVTASPQQALNRAKSATVRLEPDTGEYSGSGTVISASGLILTNAHISQPRAPGLAFHYQQPASYDDPTYLTVSVNPPGDGPAVLKYRATPLVADGYLDLGVVQISALADGSPLPAGTRFPFVPVAAVDRVSTGDPLTVLGYPGVAGEGRSLSVTAGQVSTLLRDPEGRVKAARWEIDTSARIAGGNSGGAAINADGQLIGVPSARVNGVEYSGRIRPVALAEPLLLAVARGTTGAYRTPYDVVGGGLEAGTPQGWTVDGDPCTSTDSVEPEGETLLSGAAQVTGMTTGEDVLLELVDTSGQGTVLDRQLNTWREGASGCLSTSWEVPAGFSAGQYEMRVHVGPQLRQVTAVPLSVEPVSG